MMSTKPHLSFVSGLNIDKVDGGMDIGNCHHVLYPKDIYKKMRCSEDNIVFLTLTEHELVHYGGLQRRIEYAEEMREQGIIVDWKKLDDLKEKLKNDYKLLI